MERSVLEAKWVLQYLQVFWDLTRATAWISRTSCLFRTLQGYSFPMDAALMEVFANGESVMIPRSILVPEGNVWMVLPAPVVASPPQEWE